MASSSPLFPFFLGQPVRRIDHSDTGTVVGVLLCPEELVIVRWAWDTTYEVADELIEFGGAAA
jgi:hypothetical protein